jgi:hypothetical protein
VALVALWLGIDGNLPVISHKIESHSVGVARRCSMHGLSKSRRINHPFVLALGGVAPLFAGAGAISVDERVFGRSRWPARISLGLLVIAIAVALLTWIVLNGTNPSHFEAPAN